MLYVEAKPEAGAEAELEQQQQQQQPSKEAKSVQKLKKERVAGSFVFFPPSG